MNTQKIDYFSFRGSHKNVSYQDLKTPQILVDAQYHHICCVFFDLSHTCASIFQPCFHRSCWTSAFHWRINHAVIVQVENGCHSIQTLHVIGE